MQPLLDQRDKLAKGIGIAKTARLKSLGTGTVHRLKREMDCGLPLRNTVARYSFAAAPKRVGRVPEAVFTFERLLITLPTLCQCVVVAIAILLH